MELTGIAKQIYESKYKGTDDNNVVDTWKRVAYAIAGVEKDGSRAKWMAEFYAMLKDFKVLPGGRITAGAGTKHPFLLNCAVEPITDSIEAIYEAIKRSAILAKSNYGTGFSFSALRPKNAGLSVGGIASGPVSFMRIFDTSGSVIETGGGRRAASMGVLRVDHPDIFEFIDAKRQEGILTQFNISVGITDKFMDAVMEGLDFNLVFNGKIYQTVKAADIWNKLVHSGYTYNDPGLLFIDEVNKYNNGHYMYEIEATNPCGEIPLPPHGVCDLGSINLTQFIMSPFKEISSIDTAGLKRTIHTLVRFLDNVLDVSKYPFEENRLRAQGDRRLGLCGIAGLGSALAMLGMPYDSDEARELVGALCRLVRDEAYRASINLAKEKGSFPNFDKEEYLEGNFIQTLPEDIQGDIRKYGIRNLALLTVPPVGTGSLLAGNISNGLEPIFALEYTRNVRNPDGTKRAELVEDYAWGLYKKTGGINYLGAVCDKMPAFFKTAMEIDPIDHIKMQAVIQKYVDGSLSKTANVPASYTKEDYEKLLWLAYRSGLKGFTTFREGSREAVLVATPIQAEPSGQDIKVAAPKEAVTKFARPRVLDGKTYQIKEEGNHRTYCTINSYEGKPWEIFLYSSSRHGEWYAAIGRLASRIMRKTGDWQAVIDELKEIGGDNGYLTPEYGYMQSKPQHIAHILEEYVSELSKGLLCSSGEDVGSKQDSRCKLSEGQTCPECGEKEFRKEGGCNKCSSCGYSTCG
jgi:ribonucleoside-diphosphate reductase alpha chain